MKNVFTDIQQLDLDTLDETKGNILKEELIRAANIPKLEEQVRDIILKLSNIERITITHEENINQDNTTRLKLIYSLLHTLDKFNTQTKNIKMKNDYSKDYKYTFKYIQTAQKFLKLIDMATNYRPDEQLSTIKAVAVNY